VTLGKPSWKAPKRIYLPVHSKDDRFYQEAHLEGFPTGQVWDSVMSIATLSTVSYNQWLTGMRDSRPDSRTMDDGRYILDDGRSILSEMSSDLNALDLASSGF
jgi:hypothetical protein